MGRAARQFVAGGIYHVIQRGHNRMYLFNEQVDKSHFLDCVKAARDMYAFNLLYYVLMDNHYHLVIELQTESLGPVMHRINLSYSKFYNRKYTCSGTVFSERYRSFTIDDSAYFIQLIQYIANNPVKAGIVKQPADYRWCAHLEVLSPRSSIVSARRLFEILGETDEKGMATYCDLMKQTASNGFRSPNLKSMNRKHRMDRLKSLFDAFMGSQEPLEVSKKPVKKEAEHEAVTKRIRSGSHNRHAVRLRHAFIRMAAEQGFQAAEIARFLQVTCRCVRACLAMAESST